MAFHFRRLWGILLVAFIVSAGGAANAGEYVLDFNQFAKLNAKDRAKYLGELRKAILEIEKNQSGRGIGYGTAMSRSQPFNLFLDEAIAAKGESCFIAGNSSVVGLQGTKEVCNTPAGARCPTKPGGPQDGVKCNDLIFGANTDGTAFCVLSNQATPTADCENASIARYANGKTRADAIAAMVKEILDAEKGDLKIKKDTLTLAFNNYEKSVQDNCVWKKNKSTCDKLKLASQTAVTQISNYSRVAETTRGGGTPVQGEKPPAVEPPPVRVPPVVQKGGPCEGNKPELTTMQVEHTGNQLCQFKAKKLKDHVMLRLDKVDGVEKIRMFKSDSPTGPWCEAQVKDSKMLSKKKTEKEGDKRCELYSYNFTANVPGGENGTKTYEVRRDHMNTNQCKFSDDPPGRDPDTEDFIPGVDIVGDRYSKLENGDPKTARRVSSVLLKNASNSNGIFWGKDAFKVRKEAFCPDEATRNLAYALIALSSDTKCSLSEPQVGIDGGNEKGRGNAIYIDVRTDSPLNPPNRGKIEFTTVDGNSERQATVPWVRSRDAMGVTAWLYGDKHSPHGTDRNYAGLYELLDSNACKGTKADVTAFEQAEAKANGATANQ
jgi:hypothetical protein